LSLANAIELGRSIIGEDVREVLEDLSRTRDEVVETRLADHRRRVLDTTTEGGTMADLTAKKREKLPAKEFGLPEKARTSSAKKESGNYPMPDKKHARNAKARAAQQQKAGNLTKNEKQRIDRKADKVLDK
jgi:hypothetical protein